MHGRQTGEVQQVRDPPSHRGRCVGGQRQAPGSDVNHHEVAQTFVYLSRREALDFRRQSIHMPLQRVAERGFLTNLAHRSSLPVDVHRRRRHLVRAHPLEKVRLGGEALTTREDRAQPCARAGAHIDEKVVGITVHVAEKRQASRIDRRRDSVDAVVGKRAIVHDEKTRDVHGNRTARTGRARCRAWRVQAHRSSTPAAGSTPPRAGGRSVPGP